MFTCTHISSLDIVLYYLILIFVILAVFVTQRLDQSRIGRSWIALREDEDVAQMVGVNTTRTKLLAFAVGAFIGGLGGAIFAAWQGSIFPDNFNLMVSVNVLCLIIIGGMGSIPGVIIGSVALITLPDILREFSDYRLLLFGFLLVRGHRLLYYYICQYDESNETNTDGSSRYWAWSTK